MKRFLPMFLLLAGLFPAAPGARAQAAAQVTEKGSPEAVSPEANKEAADENDAYRHSAMVAKMGKMMGMSTETAATTFEVANFAVLALALLFALGKLLPKTFRGRTAAIQKHLVDARIATEEASARLNSVEERLSKLDGQIAAMHDDAERAAQAEELKMRAAVEEEKARILAAAEQEIASASAMAQRSLQKYAAELAIEQAGRRLVVTAETDRLLIQGFARRLVGDVSKDGQN